MAQLKRVMMWIGRTVRRAFSAVFGRWQWEAPRWLRGAGGGAVRGGRYLRSHPTAAIGLALSVAGAVRRIRLVRHPDPRHVM
jgi:hypothetical protein